MPLQLIRQDITKMQVDAIVNTTNEDMVGYSGVDLAVHKGAGPRLKKACEGLAPLGTGQVKITPGYDLAAKYIIHTVGPVWQGGGCGERERLRSCYTKSLQLAMEYGCESVALPLISSGAYGYPKEQVLKFAVQVITEFLLEHELLVYLCVFDRTSYAFSKRLFSQIRELIDDRYAAERSRDRLASDEIEGRCCEKSFRAPTAPPPCAASMPCGSAAPRQRKSPSLQEYLKAMDKPFAYKLFALIDARGMTDVECYKKANVDKKTFSKIKCNPDTYKPSKQTAVAFAIALRLNLEETQELLAAAGLTLSHSFVFDKIIRFFIGNGVYDIFEINEALFEFDQVLLGSM